jgi:hypothetical protein
MRTGSRRSRAAARFALIAAAALTLTVAVGGQVRHGGKLWSVPRTVDGQPDLQGVWDYRTLTPLERPKEYAGVEFLSDEQVAELERRGEERRNVDGRPPGDGRGAPSVHPVWWLDYGRNVVGTRRSSLIVDPADGRIPPLTAEATAREAERRRRAGSRGPADGPEDRGLWERCITRGMPESMLPSGYNNNIRILQSSGHVVILLEMIHDARIVPIDGRPHLSAGIRQWLGDARGRWDGDTLVVETANFSDRTSFRGSRGALRVVERFTRLDENTLSYRFTVEDPSTWTAPWTVDVPMARSSGQVYEYACHEGNYGLRNILRAGRVADGEVP